MSFLLSKLLWPFLNLGNVLLVLLFGSTMLTFAQRYRSLGLKVVRISVLGLLLMALIPFRTLMIEPLENRFPALPALPEKVDGIVVLGGGQLVALTEARGLPQFGGDAERLVEFVRLANAYPKARLVFSGGSGSLFPGPVSEAEVAKATLAAIGFDKAPVIYEDRSRNTWENAVYSKALANPEAGEAWVLITSAAHMPRAVGAFRKAGWTVLPYPTDFTTSGKTALAPRLNLLGGISEWNAGAKEWVGLVAYYLLGQSDSVLPSPN